MIIHAHHAAVILSRIPAFWKSMNSHFRLLRDLIPWRHSWCTWCFNLLMDSKRKFYCKKHLQILNVNLKSIMAGNLHASLWKIFSILSFPSDFTCNLTTSSNKNTTDDRKLVRNMTNNGIILEQLQQRDHILFGSESHLGSSPTNEEQCLCKYGSHEQHFQQCGTPFLYK